jgi:hypothetical protein
VLLVVGAGLLAGAIGAVLTVLAEHSQIAFGSYSLFGNGALIVPGLVAPYAIFAGWTWAIRRGGRALELALFVVGLHFGLGLISILEVLFFPSVGGLTLADAAPGFVFTGAIFVDPAALLAGLALWGIRAATGRRLVLAIAVSLFVATVLGFVFGIGLGVLAGAAVGLAERDRSRTTQIAIALAVLVLVLGNLPYLGQIAG